VYQLVVLINGGSASASEVLAGAIKDTNSGILIGEKSYGKALVQVLIEMRGKDAIKLTTAKYLTPNKHDIQAKGIEPDLEVIWENEDRRGSSIKESVRSFKKTNRAINIGLFGRRGSKCFLFLIFYL
jgi:carboxyl-terminal processing protease